MTRRAIRPLPADLVSRIAAGEVIERPASVVKELVENALDAGSRRITVELEAGGVSLIRVVDDGSGIPPGELPLVFTQHATSKIATDDELHAVATMGFRGEAMASIASVSRTRIVTRTADDEAFELTCDGGDLGAVRPTAGNVGTTVEVRELFFNTPARRKFLKAPAAESGQVTDMLTRLALPRHDVAIRYVRDGKVIWDWPATDPLDRLAMAWPDEFRRGMLAVDTIDDARTDTDGEPWQIRGLLALPEFAIHNQRNQHLYVNGRPVKDRSVSHAIGEAYRGLTEPGRHPAAVLLLDVPPGDVDVNVHPTKAEVRFRDSRRLWKAVNTAAREVLLQGDLAPTAQPTAEVPTLPPREGRAEALAEFFKAQLADRQQTLLEDLPAASAPIVDATPTSSPVASTSPVVADARPTTSPPVSISPPSPVHALQLHNSYLVVQSDEGMEIIDQHALHERVIYEDLLARVRRGPLESQRLLMPATFDAPESQVALLDDLAETFARLGIEAEPFGSKAVAVHAFPSFLAARSRLDPAAFVAGVLESAEQHEKSAVGNDENLLHDVLDMMACKAAVKAGEALSNDEIAALMEQRDLIHRASNCPHGRPTVLKLSLADLEKQFKRTGF
ncbi:MAG: DNA mismatch repair endonuclease MutL [Planctomycetota bacterium]